jgi:hypothetical protein
MFVTKKAPDGGWSEVLGFTVDMMSNFETFLSDLWSSSLTVKVIKDNFSQFNNNKNDLRKELKCLYEVSWEINNVPLEKVYNQIEALFKIEIVQNSAHVVQEVAGLLHAKVDFSSLGNVLQDHDLGDIPLSKAITLDVLMAGKSFEEWEKDDIKALKTLDTCEKLIKWLRDNIHSVHQLKNFVELASISAGESDAEVDQVLFFQAAIVGYSPLLLDLGNDTTFKDFLTACNKVIESFRADPALPGKLLESNRCLEWIKAIKERHGSVEESSMTTVNQINESGVYTIAKGGVLRLVFKQLADSKKLEKLNERTFDHDNLNELRSKLMLITTGDEGKKHVERYTKILSLIEVVATKLADLVASGCHLFAKLTATVHCDKKRKVAVIVHFGYDGGAIQGGNNLKDELHHIATFLQVKHCSYFMSNCTFEIIFKVNALKSPVIYFKLFITVSIRML